MGENANDYLNTFSELMYKKGVIKQATTFAISGTLVGLGLEYIVKSNAKSAIAILVPPLHSILTVLGGVATAICMVHVASSVIDGLKDETVKLKNASASMTH
jgi:hypothetical protein